MNTLSPATVARWLNDLTEITCALAMAENVSGIEHAQWHRVWAAKIKADCIHDQLQMLAVTAVSVQRLEEVA